MGDEERLYIVSIEATLSLRVRDVQASTEQEAIDQILDELPCDFCNTGEGLNILRATAEVSRG